MVTASLIAHPATTNIAVTAIDVEVERIERDRLRLTYRISGDIAALKIPVISEPTRSDGLWRTTCCELFLQWHATAYCEFNFSPSRQWAAYGFDDRRTGMRPLEIPAPRIVLNSAAGMLMLAVELPLPEPASPLRCGPTCVIEERSGTLTYWALAHAGPAPDFHAAATLGLTV